MTTHAMITHSVPSSPAAASLSGARKAPTQHERLTNEARKWVAQSFYGTLLKQMRNSPFKSEIFDGGRGGEAFAPLLDQHLADHMTRATDNHLVSAIVRRIEGKRVYDAQKSAEKSAHKSAQRT